MVLLTLNIADAKLTCRFVKLRHVVKFFLLDIRRKKANQLYSLLHSDQSKGGNKYIRHHRIYKYSGWAFGGLVFGILVKLVIVVIMIVLVYGTIPVFAIDDQSGESVNIGDILTYQVQVTNNGKGRATDVSIVDSLPDHISYILSSIKVDGIYLTDRPRDDRASLIGRNIVVETEYLDYEESVTLEFKVRVVGLENKEIMNFAKVNYSENKKALVSNSVKNLVDNRTKCNDRKDNDSDGFVDYPDDPGCSNLDDETEGSDSVLCGGLSDEIKGLDLLPKRGGKIKKNIKQKTKFYWQKGADLLFEKKNQEYSVKIKEIDCETGKVIFTVE
jgi:uncharacterized repeat protein (TIGR01451 family)